MPTGSPQPVQLMPAQINVPTDNGLFINVSVQSDGTSPEGAIPAAVQQLVDLLQGWEGRHPLGDVAGQLYDSTLSAVTPTNPVPPPLPPEEEPETLMADESPSSVV